MNYPMIERKALRPSYYGMRANDLTFNNGPGLQSALNEAAESGGAGAITTVDLPQGIYGLTSQVYVPLWVRLRGSNPRGTYLQAQAGFPLNTPMVTLGTQGGSITFGAKVEDLAIDGNHIASDGLYTNQANELSGARNVLIANYLRYGIHYQNGAIHCDFSDLWVYNSSGASAPIGFFGDAFGGSFSIRNATFTSAAGSVSQAAAIQLVGVSAINGGHALLERIHVEHATHGIQFATNAYGTTIGVDGLSDVTNVITINSGAGTVVCIGTEKNGATHTINDLQQVIVDDSQIQPFWISSYPGASVSRGIALGGRLLTPSLFVPSAAAGANAGTSPPAPVVVAHSQDQRGTITWGSGTTASPGVQVDVTFAVPNFSDGVTVQLTATNSATATLQPYAANGTGAGFSIATVGDPTDSQANTVYSVNYSVGANS